MHDVIQHGLETLASQHTLIRDLAVFFAGKLVYVLAACWVLVILWQRQHLTWLTVARVALTLIVAFVVAKLLNHVVPDARPYLVDHVAPLITVSHDNGFPSDHTLLVAALTATMVWIDRRLVWLFALGTLLVMAGRLAVGAHHTLDVLGSVGIVIVVALVVGALTLPAGWDVPVLRAWRHPPARPAAPRRAVPPNSRV
jgi:membrane-associated phospholipid phosphatase